MFQCLDNENITGKRQTKHLYLFPPGKDSKRTYSCRNTVEDPGMIAT